MYRSAIKGVITVLGNFAFDAFGLLWMDFGIPAYDGLFYVLQKVEKDGKPMVKPVPCKEKPEPGFKRIAVRVSIAQDARDSDNNHRFATGQVRLLARDRKGGVPNEYFLAGINSDRNPRIYIALSNGEGVTREVQGANDTFDFQLTYAYFGDPFVITLNGLIGKADYDKRNPIYRKTQDDDRYGLQGSLFYKNPWGWKLFGSSPMNFFVDAAYYKADANIDFYDQEVILATGGVFLRLVFH